MLSVTAKTAQPAAASAQLRDTRQPESATAATTSASSTVSPIGYARFTATETALPCVACRIASKTSAAATAETVSPATMPSVQTFTETRGSRARNTSAMPA